MGSVAPRSIPPASHTVLVVDDDPDIRAAASLALAYDGYKTAEAGDGAEALDWLECHAPPALILLDLAMPRLTGWEVLERLQADPRWARIPVVVCTAFDSLERQKRGCPGSIPVLRKPYEIDALLGVAARYDRHVGSA